MKRKISIKKQLQRFIPDYIKFMKRNKIKDRKELLINLEAQYGVQKTLEELIPLFFSIAIAGATMNIINKSMKGLGRT